MNNLISNTALGKINRDLLHRLEDENSHRLVSQYYLEKVKAFWEFSPKKSWQFWKKDETEDEYIIRKTLESLENQRTRD